jgi:RNA polymerase sigma-70 factor (ECF subfamily)
MDDTLLVSAIIKGDSSAFKDLFERYYKLLVGYITTLTNDMDVSEDIVQQAFITLWKQRESLDVSKSIKSFLYTIAYNAYVDQYRKLKRQDVFFDELRLEAIREGIAEDNELLEQRISKLKRIVESLPPRCREVLELHKMEGLKYKEIAETLDISLKTVESQMRIAYQKIREGFEQDPMFLFIIGMVLKKF